MTGAAPLPIIVRLEQAGDVAPVRAVLAAAFGRPDEADLVDCLPQLAQTAPLDGTVRYPPAFAELG